MDYSGVLLKVKAKIKQYHELTLKNRFSEATDVAIELADLTIQLEAATLDHVSKSETA